MLPHIATTTEQFWHSVPGGTAYATGRTLRALLETGLFTFTGVTAKHSSQKGAAAAENIDPELASFRQLITQKQSRLPRPFLYESWLRFRRPRLESLIGQHDLVWASAMVTPASTAPIVTTVHDLFFLDEPEHSSRRGKYFFPLAWKVAKKHSAALVCPSAAVARDCVRFGFDPECVHSVPWGVDTIPVAKDVAAQTVKSLSLPEEFVLWVGTLEPRKNVAMLVEAMQQNSEKELVVVGPSGWNVDGVDIFSPLKGRVHRLGFVDDQTLRCLYAQAKVFVFPSLAEGFGLPILEAMVQGTPVVTSRNTATAEVADAAALLIDPKDPQDIATAIAHCWEDDALRARLSQEGKKRVASFSWEATARGYSQVFKNVLEQ